MHSVWLRSTFLRVLKFLQIKEGEPNFKGEPISQRVRLIWSPLLYFNFKCFLDPTSSSFIGFRLVVKLLQIYEGGLNFWGEPILKKVWIMWSPFQYFNFKSFLDLSPSSFARFQYILQDSGVLSSEFLNFYKLKRGHLIFWRKTFSRKSELFGPPFCISILKVF